MKAAADTRRILNNRFVFQNNHPIGTWSKPIIILAPQSMEEMVISKRKKVALEKKGEELYSELT